MLAEERGGEPNHEQRAGEDIGQTASFRWEHPTHAASQTRIDTANGPSSTNSPHTSFATALNQLI